jgi:hypothetical protein
VIIRILNDGQNERKGGKIVSLELGEAMEKNGTFKEQLLLAFKDVNKD